MQPPARPKRSWLVTGSSGFIGSHLCRELGRLGRARPELYGLDRQAGRAPVGYREILADIRDRAALKSKLSALALDVVIHLAAVAEAIIPFARMGELFDTNLNGTVNVLDVVHAERALFMSSSSVYGNTARRGDAEHWKNINPLGGYAGTKAIGELLLAAWARASGASAITLRLGNVIGPGCQGLIGYMVNHALTYPDGTVSAKLRGEGRVTRDYVPVDYVVAAIRAACDAPATGGETVACNVSSGVRLANGLVASIVIATLARKGYTLKADFDTPLFAEEPRVTALDIRRSAAWLGLEPPGRDEVVASIEAAVLHGLQQRSEQS